MRKLMGFLAAAAATLFAGVGFAETLTITVPAASAAADALYLVWGDKDKGGLLADWGVNAKLVAEGIPADGGTYEATTDGIPANSIIRALAVREIGFVESVEMSGEGQYFDTGIPASWGYGFEISVQTTGPKHGGWASLFSAKVDKLTVGSCYSEDNTLYFRYRTGEISFNQLKFVAGQRNDLHVLAPNVTLNGEDMSATLKEFGYVTDNVDRPMIEPDWPDNGPADHYCLGTCSDFSRWMSAKWYGAKIFSMGGEVICDLRPVVLDGVAGFYDTVAKQFRANSGANGNFTANGEVTGTALAAVRPAKIGARALPTGAREAYSVTFSNGAYVDTLYKPSNLTRLLFSVTVPEGSNVGGKRAYFTGALNYDTGYWWTDIGLVIANDPSVMYHVWGKGNSPDPQRVPDGRHTVDCANGIITLDGEKWSERNNRTFLVGQSVHISGYNRGGGNNPNGSQPMTFHSYKIYHDGELVRDYVPVVLIDGTATFFDRVEGQTLPIRGSGKVTASPFSQEDGVLAIDVSRADVTLGETEAADLAVAGEFIVKGRKTAWFTETGFAASNLTVKSGKLGFAAIDSQTVASLTLSGKLRVESPLEINLGEYLKAGTYTILSADAIELVDDAEITLAASATHGSGTTTRELFINNGDITITVTGDEVGVPDDWEVVPFIESHGSEYLNTKYIHKSNTKVEAVVNVAAASAQSSTTGWHAIFGARNWGAGANAFIFFAKTSNGGRAIYNRTGAETTCKDDDPFIYEKKLTLVCEGQTATWTTADGEDGRIDTTGTADDGVSQMFIFDLNKGNSATALTPDNSLVKMRLYSFRISEGATLLHDYQPIRDPNGTLGLYDKLTGQFLTNAGVGNFTTAAGKEMYVTYIESGAGQYIDTGYIHTADTKIEADVNVNPTQNSTTGWSAVFGARKWSYTANCFGFFALTGYGNACLTRTGNEHHFATDFGFDNRVTFVVEGNRLDWSNEAGQSGYTESTGTVDGGVSPMFIFDLNKAQTDWERARDNSTANMKLYSFKITDENGVQRDYIPYCDAEGVIGLADRAHGMKMYGSQTTEAFGWGGLGYMPKDSTLEIYAGVMTAADVAGYTSFRKLTAATVAMGGVDTLPELDIGAGAISLQDNRTAQLAITDTLTLAGGTTLAFDIAEEGNDSIAADKIVLSNVSDEAPVSILLSGAAIAPGRRVKLLSATNGFTADASYFRVSGIAATLEVTQEGLFVSGKDITEFRWTGEGETGDWSEAANWADGDTPVFPLPVIFDVDKNTATEDNLPMAMATDLIFGSNAAAFAIDGSETFTVSDRLVNGSQYEQTIRAPLAIGSAEAPFAIELASDAKILGEVTAKGDIVKTGAGQLTLNPLAFAAPSVEIDEGKVVLSDWTDIGLTTAQRGGDVTIAAGAQLDFAYPANAGDANKLRESFTDYKTFHIAGDGVDGSGALVNNSANQNQWVRLFSTVQLDADASIGGNARMDCRAEGDKGGTFLGEGKTLTVKATAPNYGLNFYFGSITLGKLVVAENAVVSSEGNSYVAAPGGIELKNGSQLSVFGGTWNDKDNAGTFITVDAGATATIYRHDWGAQVNLPVNVPATSTLNVSTRQGNSVIQFAFTRPIRNDGRIVKLGATYFENPSTWHLDCEYTGNGVIELTEGEISLGENFLPVVKIGADGVVDNPLPGLNVRMSTFENREAYNTTILQQVKQIKIVVAEGVKANRSTYVLGSAGGLTDADVAEITLNDGWRLAVSDGNLVAKNPNVKGMMIYVR